ncbi:ATP-binding protein [Haloarchaeobius sp. TZWWS8]|uniref:ATP-binding protein n=1 Tax=Haloarchaeobius sp. TZWWS8 TaxID=3446121 RepID=UPI003EBB1464
MRGSGTVVTVVDERRDCASLCAQLAATGLETSRETGVTDGPIGRDVDCLLVVDSARLDGIAHLDRVRPTLPVVFCSSSSSRLAAAAERGVAAFDEVPETDADFARLALRIRRVVDDRTVDQRDRLASERHRPRDLTDRVVELAPVGIMLVDPDETIRFANEYAIDHFALTYDSNEDVYRTGDFEVCYPDGTEIPREEFVFHRVRREETVASEPENVVEWPNGRKLHYSVFGAPLFDDAGDLEQVLLVLQDRTELVEHTRELEFVEQLVSQVGVGVFAYEDDGTLRLANESFARLFDASVPTVEGTPVWRWIPGVTAAEFDRFWSSVDAGETTRSESVVEPTEGPSFPVETVTTRIEVGDDAYHVGTVKDITDRKEREERLTVLNRVLRHNLRNELNVFLGVVKDLRDRADGDAPLADLAENAVQRLLSISEKARLLEQALSFDGDEVVDVSSVAAVEVDAARRRHAGTTMGFEAPETATARCSHAIGQVVEELVENAVAHADDSGQLSVDVRVECDGDVVRLVVQDDGPGIPPEEVAVLTDPTTITPLHHGSGLGLWVVNWLVRRSNGSLRFEEREPRGTRVVVEIPRAGPGDDERRHRSD